MNDDLLKIIKQITKAQGVTSQCFSMWKSRKTIPHKHQISIVQKSKELGTPLSFEQLQNPFSG